MMNQLMFGHTLRMLRSAAGISLRALAKKMEVSPAYISQVELGKLPAPTHDRMIKIAETIGIPVSLLIEMSHRPNPDSILLLRGHQELNELIKMAVNIGMESKDVFEIIALMRSLGGEGFRKLVRYGADHFTDFMLPGSSKHSPDYFPSPMSQLSFSETTDPRLVFKKLDFAEKSDLLRYMIERVSTIYGSLDSDRAYKKLMSNEAEDSSGIGNGAAIPHLFVDELDQTIVSIARIPEGIDFGAIDEKPVHLVCLILSNPDFQGNHLNLLAYFARKFQIPTLIDEIMMANSKKNILSILFDEDDANIH